MHGESMHLTPANPVGRHSTVNHLWGFVAVGLVWGIALAYIATYWKSCAAGYAWGYDVDFTLGCFVLGPGIGLLCGIATDISIQDARRRARLLIWSIALLPVCILTYFVLILPATSGIRE